MSITLSNKKMRVKETSGLERGRHRLGEAAGGARGGAIAWVRRWEGHEGAPSLGRGAAVFKDIKMDRFV